MTTGNTDTPIRDHPVSSLEHSVGRIEHLIDNNPRIADNRGDDGTPGFDQLGYVFDLIVDSLLWLDAVAHADIDEQHAAAYEVFNDERGALLRSVGGTR